jgi:hypothetical protein
MSKEEIEERASKDMSSMTAAEEEKWVDELENKRRIRLAAIPKVVPKEWQQSGTSPLKITVPEKGGSVTIEITDEKTIVEQV